MVFPTKANNQGSYNFTLLNAVIGVHNYPAQLNTTSAVNDNTSHETTTNKSVSQAVSVSNTSASYLNFATLPYVSSLNEENVHLPQNEV